MRHRGATDPEPAQGPQRPGLRGPGAEVLRLIGYPVVRQVLADLGRRSRRPSQIGSGCRVDVSTFHRHAPELLAVKAITRRVVPGPPRQVFYSLGPTGAELCALIDGWLALLPSAHRTDWRGAIGFGEAWAAGLTQALLDGPLGLPEIEMSVHLARPGVTGHQIRRLLRNEHRAGFLLSEAPRGQEHYRLADRGRYAVGELATSARFERLNMAETAVPIAVDDVVDALRAHLPLVELPAGLEGICEFVVVGDPGRRDGVALAWAEVGRGRVVASASGRPPRPADTWARGTIGQWMATVIDHRRDGIRAAGERPLGRAVVDALHTRLYRRTDPGVRPSVHGAVIAVQLLHRCNYWIPCRLRVASHGVGGDAAGVTLPRLSRILDDGGTHWKVDPVTDRREAKLRVCCFAERRTVPRIEPATVTRWGSPAPGCPPFRRHLGQSTRWRVRDSGPTIDQHSKEDS